MEEINVETLTFIMTLAAAIGIFFNVYLHFRNPQIESDQAILDMQGKIIVLEKGLVEVKEKHLYAVDQEMKSLTSIISNLSQTVTKLSTIIDERIPKQNR